MPRTATLKKLHAAAPAVLPSILGCDYGRLNEEVKRLEDAGTKVLHLDVMDGVFVPNLSFGMPIVAAIRKLTDLVLDVHLMMVNPEKYIDAFVDAGAEVLTVHAEATDDLPGLLKQIKDRDVAAGIAINPPTPVSAIESSIADADLALVMSVNAGFGGQSFMDETLAKTKAIRQMASPDSLLLEMDGGINHRNRASMYRCGD